MTFTKNKTHLGRDNPILKKNSLVVQYNKQANKGKIEEIFKTAVYQILLKSILNPQSSSKMSNILRNPN